MEHKKASRERRPTKDLKVDGALDQMALKVGGLQVLTRDLVVGDLRQMVAGGHQVLMDGDLDLEMGGDRLKEVGLVAHVDEEGGEEDPGEYVQNEICQKKLT